MSEGGGRPAWCHINPFAPSLALTLSTIRGAFTPSPRDTINSTLSPLCQRGADSAGTPESDTVLTSSAPAALGAGG